MAMTLLATMGAALLYALASVLQQRSAQAQASQRSLHLSLLVGLAGRPLWLAGIVVDVAAYALQFLALQRGSLSLVQPLMVCGLLFALPLGAALCHRRMSAGDWVGVVFVAAGLGLFLGVASPTRGRGHPTDLGWIVVLAVTLGPAAVLVGFGRALEGARRAVCLAGAAALLYVLTATLTLSTGQLLRHGVVDALGSWQPYALAGCGLVAILVVQSAFQAGPLGWSLPTIAVIDPLGGVAVGVLALHERIATHPLALVLEVIGLAAMAAGVYLLSNSPMLPIGTPAAPAVAETPERGRRRPGPVWSVEPGPPSANSQARDVTVGPALAATHADPREHDRDHGDDR